MIQMNIPRTQAFTNVKGVDKEFDLAVERFYKPYHDFLDIFFRSAVTSNIFTETLVNLSLVTGIEAVGWHFGYFPTFWVGINKNKTTQRWVDWGVMSGSLTETVAFRRYTELFINNSLIHEFIDRILKEERVSLNDSMIANFIEVYYGKVRSANCSIDGTSKTNKKCSQVRTQLSLTKLLDAICSSMVQKDNWEEVCGDLHAVRIIGQTGGFPKQSKENLKRSLQCVLQKSKEFAAEGMVTRKYSFLADLIIISSTEESPPKKRKIDAVQEVKANNVNQPEDEKMEPDSPTKSDEAEEKPPTEPKEVEKIENESKEAEKQAPVVTSSAPGSSNALTSTRSDLIKDIESHIEIIYECLDELNETGATSALNKTSSSDVITLSSETSSQDADKTVNEATDDGGTSKDPPAQEESKPE